MDNSDFEREYKRTFDNIHAGDKLKEDIINMKKPKRSITPFKATIGTVAAAIMIFAAVNEYNFEQEPDGVISETAVSTAAPATDTDAKFEAMATPVPASEEKTVKPVQKKAMVTVSDAIPSVAPMPVKDDVSSVASKSSTEETPTEEVLPDNEGIAVSAWRMSTDVESTVNTMTVSEYYEYIGKDLTATVNAVIPVRYTGADEFATDDDIAVFTFDGVEGGDITLKVSKSAFFNSSLDGDITGENEIYDAYKISNGVNYEMHSQEISKDKVTEIVDSL